MSITYDKGVFVLGTDCTSYIFRVTKFGHLEHIHYGERVAASDAEALSVKHDIQIGSSVMYDTPITAIASIISALSGRASAGETTGRRR